MVRPCKCAEGCCNSVNENSDNDLCEACIREGCTVVEDSPYPDDYSDDDNYDESDDSDEEF